MPAEMPWKFRTSIDQTKYDTARENNLPMNIYLTVTPLDDFTEEATKVISLTNYTESGKAFMGVKITKVNDNRFMVSWEEYNDETEGSGTEEDTLAGSTLHYVFIDGKGNRISQSFIMPPIKIWWIFIPLTAIPEIQLRKCTMWQEKGSAGNFKMAY